MIWFTFSTTHVYVLSHSLDTEARQHVDTVKAKQACWCHIHDVRMANLRVCLRIASEVLLDFHLIADSRSSESYRGANSPCREPESDGSNTLTNM